MRGGLFNRGLKMQYYEVADGFVSICTHDYISYSDPSSLGTIYWEAPDFPSPRWIKLPNKGDASFIKFEELPVELKTYLLLT